MEQFDENSNAEMRQAETHLENSVIPIIEEQAVIGKRIVETGKVRISKRVSEHEKIIDEPLLHEEVTVERVAVNQYVETPPEIRQEGDMMIIPVIEEQLVLKKTAFSRGRTSRQKTSRRITRTSTNYFAQRRS